MTGMQTPAPPGTTDAGEDEASYGTRIEDAFIAERGTPFLLAPKDWLLIRGWHDGGVPVDTVIRAVRGAFEKKRARGDLSKISSLSYCANAVDVLWEMERRGLVGAHSPKMGPDDEPFDPAPRLRDLVESLKTAGGPAYETANAGAAEALEAARAAIESLEPAAGLEAVEDALAKVEKQLVKRLEKSLPEEERERLASEIAEEAGDVSSLPKETQRRILSALRGRAIRRRFGLVPMTLLSE